MLNLVLFKEGCGGNLYNVGIWYIIYIIQMHLTPFETYIWKEKLYFNSQNYNFDFTQIIPWIWCTHDIIN